MDTACLDYRLTEAERLQFERDGYFIVEDALDSVADTLNEATTKETLVASIRQELLGIREPLLPGAVPGSVSLVGWLGMGTTEAGGAK